MTITVRNIQSLLEKKEVSGVESAIVDELKCNLYRENLSLLASFSKEEIDVSGLSLEKIERFIERNPNEIVEFGQLLFEDSKPESLGKGIAISYAIYLIYLKEKRKKDLYEYLKRREVLKSKKMLARLQLIKMNMQL